MSTDFQEPGYGETRVLWSRIGILAAVLLVVFFLGRWSAPNPETSEEDLQEANAQVTELQQRVNELEAELDAQAAGGVGGAQDQPVAPETEPAGDDEGTQDEGTEPETEPTDEATAAEAAEAAESYEVQSGDTLRSIAEQFYGNPELWERIAEANNLSRDNLLTVGTVLEIPPAD